MVDAVIQGKNRTFRKFGSFYTESDPILTYMVTKLGVKDGDKILEPCAGDGVFISKILDLAKDNTFQIEALDLNPLAIEKLEGLFKNEQRVQVRQADTLLDTSLDLKSASGGFYNKIIGNPPYGAWQEFEKRNLLKKKFGGYVKETYTLFINHCLNLLKDRGRLVFIIPDTFLALNLHKDLRKKILTETMVEEILMMPSKFFPGVNFGYSNLCIITLTKNRNIKNHQVKLVTIKHSVNDLYEIAKGNYVVANKFEQVGQLSILDSINHSFFIGGDSQIRELLNNATLRLKDVADCVTGFYSGDNKKFIQVKNSSVKGSKGYEVVNQKNVEDKYYKLTNIIDGLENGKLYIPYLKGGNGRFYKETDCYVRWDRETIRFYKINKASRFQNSQYYFKEGIGVPMVKSANIHAFLIEKRLFDQSIVGIFPKNEKYLYYLLAFLNTDVCSKILKTINHTANNSANYMKSLPIILDDLKLADINKYTRQCLDNERQEDALQKINEIFNSIYKI